MERVHSQQTRQILDLYISQLTEYTVAIKATILRVLLRSRIIYMDGQNLGVRLRLES